MTKAAYEKAGFTRESAERLKEKWAKNEAAYSHTVVFVADVLRGKNGLSITENMRSLLTGQISPLDDDIFDLFADRLGI